MRNILAWGAVFGICTAAGAQTVDSTEPTIDVQLFRPTAGGNNLITVETGDINTHLGVSAGLFVNYANRPLAVRIVKVGGDKEDVGEIVGYRIQADATAAIGLFNIGELGISVPYLLQGGLDSQAFADSPVPISVGTDSIEGAVLGDVRVIPKVRVLQLGDGLLSAALVGTVIIPTGEADYGREHDIVYAPSLALNSRPMDRLNIALQAGYRVRKRTEVQTLVVDDEIFARLGAAYDLVGTLAPIQVIGEVFGHTAADKPFGLSTSGLESDFEAARTSFEANAGVRWWITEHFAVSGGLGGGITPGYGSPSPRAYAGVTYYSGQRGAADADQDGVPDSSDNCPDKKEDRDGFEDHDGCPDIDNDNDNVLDEDDQCPNEPEGKRDGFNDEDGCPDPDNDEDGVLDEDDNCPTEAEDRDGFEDDDGCPDYDNDNDGVADTVDKCPMEPEDIDNFNDADGCPDPDNDGDGLADLNDLCPNFAEDKDGVADDDGCPEDNDGDGIPDADDKCPNEAETYNGVKDEDGCPEKLKTKSLVKVTEEKIEIKEKVFFKTGSATVQKRSFKLLDQVVAVLKNYKHIKKVRIEGHTDSRGSKRRNTRLSQKRAEAVRDYLISKGIAAERLTAEGFGPKQPIASNRSRRGREQNRRVEFVIEEMTPPGESVAQEPPPPPPPTAPEGDGGGDSGLFEMEIGGEGSDAGGDAAPEPEPKSNPKKKKGKKKKEKKDDDGGGEIEFGF